MNNKLYSDILQLCVDTVKKDAPKELKEDPLKEKELQNNLHTDQKNGIEIYYIDTMNLINISKTNFFADNDIILEICGHGSGKDLSHKYYKDPSLFPKYFYVKLGVKRDCEEVYIEYYEDLTKEKFMDMNCTCTGYITLCALFRSIGTVVDM